MAIAMFLIVTPARGLMLISPNFSNTGADQLLHTVPLGIALGLFLGKQIGVFGLCFLAIKLGLTTLPKGMSWISLYGTAALCGIGFTMSLFIGSLAFEETGVNNLFDERLGIILGSLFSGVLGYMVLQKSLNSGKQIQKDTLQAGHK